MARTRNLTRIPVGGRLKPPATLSPSARRVFELIVGAVAAEHFEQADLPLVVQYAEAAALAEQAQAEIDANGPVIGSKVSPWLAVSAQAIKSCVALSARLRLAPQSRFDRLRAGTTSRPQRGPWVIPPPAGPDPLDEFVIAGTRGGA